MRLIDYLDYSNILKTTKITPPLTLEVVNHYFFPGYEKKLLDILLSTIC